MFCSKSLFTKIRLKAKWKRRDLLFKYNGRKKLLQNRPGGRILLYHGIDTIGRKDLNARFISLKEFEKHIAYFKSNFHVIPLANYFNGERHNQKLTLAITFDDGYLNNLTLAWPVLQKYQVPASFFITGIAETGYPMLWPDWLDLASSKYSGPIELEGVLYRKKRGEYYHPDGRRLKSFAKLQSQAFKEKLYAAFPQNLNITEDVDLYEYWQQMGAAQIRRLSVSPLAIIGSHGYFHNNLVAMKVKEAKAEISQSKRYLENIIQQPVNSIAYPDGSYSRALVAYAKSLGMVQQLAVNFLFEEDKEEQVLAERLVINPFISFHNQIASILQGHY